MVSDLDISKETKLKLKQTLKKYPTLFGRGLGTIDMRLVEIELIPDSKPNASKFYNVPKAYDRKAKKEMNCLCTIN